MRRVAISGREPDSLALPAGFSSFHPAVFNADPIKIGDPIWDCELSIITTPISLVFSLSPRAGCNKGCDSCAQACAGKKRDKQNEDAQAQVEAGNFGYFRSFAY